MARWTLAGAVVGSILLLGATVLLVGRPEPEAPPLELAGPWEPPPVVDTPYSWESAPVSSAPAAAPITTSPAATRSPAKRPPATKPPRTAPPTTRPATPPAAPNQSLRDDGGADGSTKAQGRSFKDVRDGDLGTFWSPVGATGEISVKWTVPVPVSRIRIRESGDRRIGNWQVRNHDNDAVLASGSGAGVITFRAVTLRKITFVILGSRGTPRVAEYETFAR
ncbi:hypothetical protein [Actinoplanes sp. NBRC 103695]|uniref:hypothetical protein n=1 Tax=Actinoplanes sp. NBRC 103695 TaxID=3032202 RepID=UPI002557169A|nr:hypothetical protein [Actinoplanes sp. NBRC 103695]